MVDTEAEGWLPSPSPVRDAALSEVALPSEGAPPVEPAGYPDHQEHLHTLMDPFWESHDLPLGAVLVFEAQPEDAGGRAGLVALLVTGITPAEAGPWLTVKVLGGTNEDRRKEAVGFFSKKKKQVHLCKEADCHGGSGLHLTELEYYYPPGLFNEPYMEARMRREMNKFLDELKKRGTAPPPGGKGTGPGRQVLRLPKLGQQQEWPRTRPTSARRSWTS